MQLDVPVGSEVTQILCLCNTDFFCCLGYTIPLDLGSLVSIPSSLFFFFLLVLAFSRACISVLYIYRDWVAITALFIHDLRCYGWEGSMVDFISDLPILSFSRIHDVLLFFEFALIARVIRPNQL